MARRAVFAHQAMDLSRARLPLHDFADHILGISSGSAAVPRLRPAPGKQENEVSKLTSRIFVGDFPTKPAAEGSNVKVSK